MPRVAPNLSGYEPHWRTPQHKPDSPTSLHRALTLACTLALCMCANRDRCSITPCPYDGQRGEPMRNAQRQEPMRSDQAFFTTSLSLAEIKKHRTADASDHLGSSEALNWKPNRLSPRREPQGGQLVSLASFHRLGLPTPKTSSDSFSSPLLLPALRIGLRHCHGL